MINKSDHSSLLFERAMPSFGEETIDKMIKDIMPSIKEDSPLDPSMLPKTSIENQDNLIEISIDMSKREVPFEY